MKNRLYFVLSVMIAAVLFFSCASDDVAETFSPEETVPVIEADEQTVTEDEVILPESIVEPEPVTEPDLMEEPAAEPEQVPAPSQPEEFVLTEDYIENEFVPFEDEPLFTVDVVAYYDDFSVAEDEFVDAELEPVPGEVAETCEPIIQSEIRIPVLKEEDEIRKPVVVITEEQAVAASEIEKAIALAELESILENIPEEESKPELTPSRSVKIKKNDIIDVPYQGNWWVYLGDAINSNTLIFMGRDYVSEKTVFTLRAVKEGTALLHFFKQDIIGDVMVDDYLEVTVEEGSAVSEKVTLDEFVIRQMDVPPADEEKPADEPVQMNSEVDDAVQKEETAVSAPLYEVSEENETVFVSEESEVTSVIEENVISDEDLFLKAQELEKTDIEEALNLYRKLVSDYPASPYWNQANRRITYINRFYFFKR